MLMVEQLYSSIFTFEGFLVHCGADIGISSFPKIPIWQGGLMGEYEVS